MTLRELREWHAQQMRAARDASDWCVKRYLERGPEGMTAANRATVLAVQDLEQRYHLHLDAVRLLDQALARPGS